MIRLERERRPTRAARRRLPEGLEKTAFVPLPLLHFPAFARNMPRPWDRGCRGDPAKFPVLLRALDWTCRQGNIILRRFACATMCRECQDERLERF
jgi:hypothetical protein